MKPVVAVISILVGLFATVDLQAHEGAHVDDLIVGSRLRVFMPRRTAPLPVTGTLVGWDGKILMLSVKGLSRPVAIPCDVSIRIEVSRGKQTNAGDGALVGAFAVGAPMTIAMSAVANDGVFGIGTREVLLVATVSSAVGAFLGLVIGSLIETERWERVELSRFRVELVPTVGRGTGLALSWRF